MYESEVEDHLVDYAEARGCLCLKLVLLNERGWHDRTIITPAGKLGTAELKRPKGGKASPHQKRWARELDKRSVPTAFVNSKIAAENFVNLLLWDD